jgi:hypothetical protein
MTAILIIRAMVRRSEGLLNQKDRLAAVSLIFNQVF